MDAITKKNVKVRKLSRKIPIVAILLVFAGAMMGGPAAQAKPEVSHPGGQAAYVTPQSNEVYKRLVTIPWFSVFDNLDYSIQGHTVTVSGQVVFPLTRSSVASSLEGIPGVTRVVNNVTELPFTPFDNQIRGAEYRTLFNYNSPLFRYSLGATPQIHIIVDNGHVTLVGAVSSKMDRQIAGMRARSVPNVFSVTNDLQVVK